MMPAPPVARDPQTNPGDSVVGIPAHDGTVAFGGQCDGVLCGVGSNRALARQSALVPWITQLAGTPPKIVR
jgi:hypothetical protein